MNSNGWMFLASLFALLLCFIMGISTRRGQRHDQRKIYAYIALFFLLFALIGGVSITWNITHPSSIKAETSPLAAQSQIILQTWDHTVSRTSLSGKDGTVHWIQQDTSQCTNNRIYIVADGILYQKGAIRQTQEICIQATRLADNAKLWSTTINTSESAADLAQTSSLGDQIKIANHKLYFFINATFYILNASDGKILHTLLPTISGDKSPAIINFVVNDQALVIFYVVSGIIHSSTPYVLVSIQPSTGVLLWRSQPGIYHDLIALQGTTIYAYRTNKSIVALNAHNASQLWQKKFNQNIGILAGSTTADSLYVRAQNTFGSAHATVYALNADTGRTRWQVPVDSWAGVSTASHDGLMPIEDKGLVYITDTNSLSAYQATTGQQLWQYKEDPLPEDSIRFDPYHAIYFSSPMIVGDTVFVLTTYTYKFPPSLQLVPPACIGPCRIPLTGILALHTSSGKLYWRHEFQTSAHEGLYSLDVALLTGYTS